MAPSGQNASGLHVKSLLKKKIDPSVVNVLHTLQAARARVSFIGREGASYQNLGHDTRSDRLAVPPQQDPTHVLVDREGLEGHGRLTSVVRVFVQRADGDLDSSRGVPRKDSERRERQGKAQSVLS